MAEIFNFSFLVEFHLDDVIEVLLEVGLKFQIKIKVYNTIDKYHRKIH